MRKKFIKTVSVVLIMITVLSLLPYGIPDVPGSHVSASSDGVCGENLTWALDDLGTLTVSGNGRMTDYSDFDGTCAPWYNDRDSIKEVVIESGVTSIGNEAFKNCSGITSVTISDSVAEIGRWAFGYCLSLMSVTIPDSVRTLGDNAFSGCLGITSVTIPESVVSIGYGAFGGCGNLTVICYPGSVAEEYAINNGLEYLYINTGDLNGKCGEGLTWELGSDGILEIKGTGKMDDYDAGDLLYAPWYRLRSSIKSVIIGNGVETIGGYAFYFFENIEEVTIPDSVASIEQA